MCIIYKYKRCVLSLVLMAAFSSLVWGAIPALEREALINFYNSTNGDQWVIKSGWKTPPLHTDGFAMPGTEGSWYGITVQDDHVIQINLEWNQLTGIMGVIPPAIGNLGNLRLLRLEGFQLTGNIPPEVGNLGNLQTLILDLNDLNGSIPPELGNLSNLQILNLGFNYLSGSIPPELGNLGNLQELSLYYNQLSGSIPSQLGNLVNLKMLCLSYNPLSGNIPSSFGNLINLENLSLELCTLNAIPTELGNLSKLKVLNLHNAQLRGFIPPQLGNLMNLQSLYLDYNQLSGSIPPELGNLGNLQSLDLNTNKLNGEIPTSLTNLIKVTALDIGYNCLQATDPTLRSWLNTHDPDWEAHQNQCEEAPTITVTSPNGGESWAAGSTHSITWTATSTISEVNIEYSIENESNWITINPYTANNGSYTWTVPDINSSKCKIKINAATARIPVDVSDNTFTIYKGIPAQEREALIAFYNSTNGDGWINKNGWKTPPLHTDGFAMPGTEGSWYGITVQDDHVTNIYMYENNPSGCIPPELEKLSQLSELSLLGGQLGGSIPASLGNLINLKYLALPTHRLSGSIPPELGNLHNLISLNIWENQLSGNIPARLGNLSNLQELFLANNQLGGVIPPELGNLYNLKNLCLPGNLLRGSIPPELGNLRNLDSLHLGANQLSGTIPPQLGNLANLQELVLFLNQLGGGIPREIGNLTNLDLLLLNDNQLSGKIPSSLINLTKIITLDLGFNCLYATAPKLRAWLKAHDPDWEAHQNQCGESPAITVTSPNGGERWLVGSSHAITWTTTGTVANVKIEYSRSKVPSWEIITASTANTGSYTWTIPDTISSHCRIKISDASDGTPTDTGDAFFSIIKPPIIRLNRTKLHFCASSPENVTGPQEIWINNGGGEILNWSIISDYPWLTGSPDQGTGNGIISVSVNPMGLAEGTYTGTIAVSDPNAVNSPQTVSVTLKVKTNSEDMAPFGEFLTPLDDLTVGSSIPVTGWVLDDVGIQSVKIYREEADAQLVFIGDAVLVEGARPDVEGAFPDFPNNYKAGWGYMLLTNFLPNGGNGVFKLHAIVEDMAGNSIDLGVKTITVDNANAVKPFGAIDTPTQGGTASGSSFINWGWVLTPRPNIIPENASTIHVWVDGIDIGHPVYNNYREDIAAMFPGYANSNGAIGYFYLNTAPYENGIHTLSWTATDSGGNIDGIGSRYFAVQNNGTDQGTGSREKHKGNPAWSPVFDTWSSITDRNGAVRVKKGFDSDIKTQEMYPDDNGIITIEIKELERVEIHFRAGSTVNLSPLPIGSTFDSTKGVFYWQPGPGFVGAYRFVFVEKDEAGQVNRKDIIVNIMPM